MLRKLLPHVAILLSEMYVIFFVIDKFNAPMAFINNSITKALLLILCIITSIESLYLIRVERRRARQQQMQDRRPPTNDRRPPRQADMSYRDYDRRYATNQARAPRRYAPDAQPTRTRSRWDRY